MKKSSTCGHFILPFENAQILAKLSLSYQSIEDFAKANQSYEELLDP